LLVREVGQRAARLLEITARRQARTHPLGRAGSESSMSLPTPATELPREEAAPSTAEPSRQKSDKMRTRESLSIREARKDNLIKEALPSNNIRVMPAEMANELLELNEAVEPPMTRKTSSRTTAAAAAAARREAGEDEDDGLISREDVKEASLRLAKKAEREAKKRGGKKMIASDQGAANAAISSNARGRSSR
jgi:hypothetical protein